MGRPKWKSTKAQYARLKDDPYSLFEGVKVDLWPNGSNEIWFSTPDGLSFALKVSTGPVGMGFEFRAAAGTPKITHGISTGSEDKKLKVMEDDTYVSGCQYRQDEYSLQFKEWYWGNGKYPGDPPTEEEEANVSN